MESPTSLKPPLIDDTKLLTETPLIPATMAPSRKASTWLKVSGARSRREPPATNVMDRKLATASPIALRVLPRSSCALMEIPVLKLNMMTATRSMSSNMPPYRDSSKKPSMGPMSMPKPKSQTMSGILVRL